MTERPKNKNELVHKTYPPWAHLIAGGAGGMLGAVITSPLEVVKTRLQARYHKSSLQSGFKFGFGTIRALSVLRREEGIKGLYRGLGPHLFGVVPSRAIYFFTYGTSKQLYIENLGMNPEGSAASFSAGVTAGAVVVTTTQPIWLVKTRMQLQTKTLEVKYKNSLDAILKIYKQEGLRVFYKGMTASYVGISESSLQFVLYEKFRNIVKRRHGGRDDLHPLECLAAASLSKLIASALTYPHEVIRTRLREPGKNIYKGVFNGLMLIYRTEGVPGLYGGMSAHLFRVVPNAAIMFLTYELVLRALSHQI
ncbi:uncharacterized protein LOC126322419 [Schistocerca gregaria]|uniref:uncharacterized protein LOC126322419 n=1 Tax=Schistocerca gregaria TaxID=7010 RepID=UPI00211E1126|nr:uncharacterized protein LOC126322419 [Schistocerca gregaria]XP_049850302.1 uncharacterized protein LOC126322419 [Schistocerca gregaria]